MTPSTTTKTPSTTTTPPTTTKTPPTTPCRCFYNNTFYKPGDRIYNQTGTIDCGYVMCNAVCRRQNFTEKCPFSSTILPPSRTTLKNPDCVTCVNGVAVQVIQDPNPCSATCPNGRTPTIAILKSDCSCYTKCPNCVGPDGMTREIGASWQVNCKICTCLETYGGTVYCTPVVCEDIEPKVCTQGRDRLPVLDPNNQCCPKFECRCRPDACSNSVIKCQPGFQPTCAVFNERDCCPSFKCDPKKVCVVDGIEYQPGVILNIASEPCSKCNCSWDVDPETQKHTVQCQTIKCFTECQLGFEYRMLPLSCCGTCVQVACILQTEFNTTHIIKPGDYWFPKNMNCSFYTCNFVKGKPNLNFVKKMCPVVTVRGCKADSRDVSKCCANCNADLCHLKTKVIYYSKFDNSSFVEYGYCEADRSTTDGSDASKNNKKAECDCCEPIQSSIISVKIEELSHPCITAEKCGCNACLKSD